MKMTKVALVVAGMCAASAFAQDAGIKTNLYGQLDVAYVTATNQAANVSTSRVISSGDAPSIFGFTGTKDLANGMKAGVTLEGNVDAGTGKTDSNSATFARSANFSLSGSLGTIRAGRQYDPAFLAFAATDPRGASMNNSGLNPWAFSGGLVFDSNIISWTNSFGGFTPTVGFGTGNSTVAGNSAGSVSSLGLVYANGPLTLSGGSQTTTASAASSTDPNTTGSNFGANYTMGNLKLGVNTFNFKKSDNSLDLTTTGLGGTYNLGGGLTANLAYYASKDNKNGGNANNTTFGVSYVLDKQVTMYAQVGSFVTDATGFNGATNTDTTTTYTGAAGKTVQTMYLGTRVSF